MLRLFVFFLLSTTLVACGFDGNSIYDAHSKRTATFHNVSSVVSGTVATPPNENLAKVELLYFDATSVMSLSAPPCGESDIPGDGVLLPKAPWARFCEDNNYYFSDVRYQSSFFKVVRARFNKDTFYDRLIRFDQPDYLLPLFLRSEVILTEYYDWNGKNGFSLAVSNRWNVGVNQNLDQVAHLNLSYKAAKVALSFPADSVSWQSMCGYYTSLGGLSRGVAPKHSAYSALADALYKNMAKHGSADQNYSCSDWFDCHDKILQVQGEICALARP